MSEPTDHADLRQFAEDPQMSFGYTVTKLRADLVALLDERDELAERTLTGAQAEEIDTAIGLAYPFDPDRRAELRSALDRVTAKR